MNIGFTGKAQNALNRALAFACEMGHTIIGSEHVLLGLLSESDGIAGRVLSEKGLTLDDAKKIIEDNSGVGEETHLTPADMTPRTKKIIEQSARIAMNMGHGYVGTEHILELELLDEADCGGICGIHILSVRIEFRQDFDISKGGCHLVI